MPVCVVSSMAIIKKRNEFWTDFYDATGKRHREPVGRGASYSLAKQVLAKRLADAAENRYFPARIAMARKFSEVSAKFWELHGSHLRSNTWRYMMPKFNATFGRMKIGDINAGDIQKLYNEIASRRTHSTARRYMTLLRLIFNKAKVWGDFIGENPCSGVKLGREANHRIRYLTSPEIETLLGAANPRLWPVVAIALLTGMRRGEILGLTWENVDLNHGRLYILQSKSGLPRELPISPKLAGVLHGIGPKAKGPIVDLPVIMLRRLFSEALRGSRIASFRFHDLRHTFASHYVMAGGDLLTLSRILGHTTTAMTQRYAHLASDYLAAKVAAMETSIPVGVNPGMAIGWNQGCANDATERIV